MIPPFQVGIISPKGGSTGENSGQAESIAVVFRYQ
jgi:hypothetical protein